VEEAPKFVMPLKQSVTVTELGLSKAAMCEFSKSLGATSKFHALEG